MNDAIRMQISAFVDGELPDNEADLLLRRMGQDAELRQKVAEYLAIGRVMRGEASVPGVDRIHERVWAAIDDKPLELEQETLHPPQSRAIRPLAGVAVAATVALLAIFGLQQTTGVDGTDVVPPEVPVAELPVVPLPQQIDEQLRQYYLSHGETMNARRITTLIRDFDPAEPEDSAADGETESTDEKATQP